MLNGFVPEHLSRRDGSIDVAGSGLTAEKVFDLWAFRRFIRQRREARMTAKIAPWEHIKRIVWRVELSV